MNSIQREDYRDFSRSFDLSENLVGSSFLITGATGLIGSTLVHCLLALNKGIEITCPIRNMSKAKSVFGDLAEQICFIECDLLTYLENLAPDKHFQYIVHCASPTSGSFMKDHPVETFGLAIESTRLLLEYSLKVKAKGMVYVSSLEYYGQNNNNDIITESFRGYINASTSRSSYPLGKRAAEYLCVAYAFEYDVPVKVARLTQTFGAGVAADDNRVFSQFAHSILNGSDIVLHTTGESAKPYCYTIDCVSAILYILLKGQNGEAYNVANSETYISVRNMAEFLRARFSPDTHILVELHPEMGYAPATKLRLDASKLTQLGWKPRYALEEMFDRTIRSMQEDAL